MKIQLGALIACICEGSAEQAIIDNLLDNHLLIFEREQIMAVLSKQNKVFFENEYVLTDDFYHILLTFGYNISKNRNVLDVRAS